MDISVYNKGSSSQTAISFVSAHSTLAGYDRIEIHIYPLLSSPMNLNLNLLCVNVNVWGLLIILYTTYFYDSKRNISIVSRFFTID